MRTHVGFSFGRRHYDVEGVRRAVNHFLQRGISVVVVTKDRPEVKREDLDHLECVEVVTAERTDDVVVLKLAQARLTSRSTFPWRLSKDMAGDAWGV